MLYLSEHKCLISINPCWPAIEMILSLLNFCIVEAWCEGAIIHRDWYYSSLQRSFENWWSLSIVLISSNNPDCVLTGRTSHSVLLMNSRQGCRLSDQPSCSLTASEEPELLDVQGLDNFLQNLISKHHMQASACLKGSHHRELTVILWPCLSRNSNVHMRRNWWMPQPWANAPLCNAGHVNHRQVWHHKEPIGSDSRHSSNLSRRIGHHALKEGILLLVLLVESYFDVHIYVCNQYSHLNTQKVKL